jgi:hypothetical protein
MTRKLNRLEDYISSRDAADLLSQKFNRRIDPDYIRKLKNVRSRKANERCYLYNREDLEQVTIKQKHPTA